MGGPVLLIAPTRTVFDLLREMTAGMGVPGAADHIRNAEWGLDYTSVQGYSTVLVDEAQDFSFRNIASLEAVAAGEPRGGPTLFLAVDANQSLISQGDSTIARLVNLFDVITLSYCYRSTAQIVRAALAMLSRMHASYKVTGSYIEAGRDAATGRYAAALRGPDVGVRHVTAQQAADQIVAELRRIRSIYPADVQLPVILVGSPSQAVTRRLAKLIGDSGLGSSLITASVAKGRDYLAGLVVDFSERRPMTPDVAGSIEITPAAYRRVTPLYVALTRFRDRVVCLYVDPQSPLSSFRTEGRS